MEKINLQEGSPEFKALREEWLQEASKQTLETLPAFLNHLMNDYEHDYGTVVRAISTGAVATAWAMNNHPEQGGITGFQASFVMWGFVRQWLSKDSPLTLTDFGDMLYPQYADRFDQTLSASTWKWVQEKAVENIEKHEDGVGVSTAVMKHWRSIADGKVPFGWRVEE